MNMFVIHWHRTVALLLCCSHRQFTIKNLYHSVEITSTHIDFSVNFHYPHHAYSAHPAFHTQFTSYSFYIPSTSLHSTWGQYLTVKTSPWLSLFQACHCVHNYHHHRNTIITINFIINLCWLCVYHSIWKASNHIIIILENIIVILGIWHVISHTFILSLVHSIARVEHTTCADHTLIHILTDLCTNHWLLHKHYTLVHHIM